MSNLVLDRLNKEKVQIQRTPRKEPISFVDLNKLEKKLQSL